MVRAGSTLFGGPEDFVDEIIGERVLPGRVGTGLMVCPMPLRKRPQGALSAVAAIALAAAGLALLTTPAQSASAAWAAAPTKKGYTCAAPNPTPYTLTQPDG